jgi:dimethylhistidine N-methyltransferase
MNDAGMSDAGTPDRIDRSGPDDVVAEVLAGLRLPQKALSPKFFYDAEGSRLFEQITRLDAYYPTRTEMAILREQGPALAAAAGPDAAIVEFGSGNSEKIRLLLDVLERPRAYVPIDISAEHMQEAADAVNAEYPDLTVIPVAGDYTKPMQLPAHPALAEARLVGFFPGSTIGNFQPAEAVAFLRSAREILRNGDLLIGIDLQKDPEVLHRAYNDPEGVTAAFNLNMLSNLNTLIGADFDPSGFAHKAFYNQALGRIEMHLVSLRPQTVTIDGERIVFAEGETIHTESSHKYTFEGVRRLAAAAGWQVKQIYCDERQWFSFSHFVAG